MFEHYMTYQATDPRRRRRLQIALAASGVTTFSLITFMWVANKMNIARVDPPTISYIMVQMSMDEPPPPPPPPPPPASEQVEEDIPDEEVPLEEDVVQPKEIPDKVPETKNMKVPSGVPGGVPGGIPGGMPGGLAGGVATKREPPKEVEKKPIQAVMRQGLYTPDPDPKKLATTKSAMFTRANGSNKTYFCVDTSGNTTDIRTTKRFPGDPQIDQIIAETVRKWRFRPFMVGSKPMKTCTTYTFEIEFKGK